MSSPHDRPTPPRGHHPPTATAELFPVLAWLNRHELASRFPAWQAHPRRHAGSGEPEASQDELERGRSR